MTAPEILAETLDSHPTTTEAEDMTTTHRPTTVRRLASGALVELDATGRATTLRCPWLIEVASGNPEPDFPSDCWTTIECGATMRADGPDGERCDAGHGFGNMEWRLGPGGTEWQREQMDRIS